MLSRSLDSHENADYCSHRTQGKELELKEHTDSVDGVSWSPTHPDLVATASADKSVRLWDLRGISTKSTSQSKRLACFLARVVSHRPPLVGNLKGAKDMILPSSPSTPLSSFLLVWVSSEKLIGPDERGDFEHCL